MAPLILVFLSVMSLHPAARRDSSAQKTWTNDDIDSLRANSPISIFRTPASLQFATMPARSDESTVAKAPYVPYVKELDPDWYAKEIDAMQTRIATSDAVIQRIEDIRKSGVGISNVIPLDREDVGLTPESTITILQAQNQVLAAAVDNLEELARRNYIPPGAIR
jgi:hypothetical protein